MAAIELRNVTKKFATADGGVPGPDVQYRIGSITKTLTAILVLRLMSRRWREGQTEVDAGGPYGPRPTPEREAPKELVT